MAPKWHRFCIGVFIVFFWIPRKNNLIGQKGRQNYSNFLKISFNFFGKLLLIVCNRAAKSFVQPVVLRKVAKLLTK